MVINADAIPVTHDNLCHLDFDGVIMVLYAEPGAGTCRLKNFKKFPPKG